MRALVPLLLLVVACLCCVATAQNHSCVQADNVVFTGEVETVCNISSFNNLAVFLCNMTGAEQALVGCPVGGPYTSLKQPFWLDADGDGYGASNCNSSGCSQIFACTKPAGYARNNLDCDDTNALIFPGSVLCKTGTADTLNLQTLWPPAFNFSFPNSQCRQSSPNVTQWGAGLSLHNNLLFMGSICGTVGLVWHFDGVGQFWVAERNFSFTPFNQPDAIDFAHSASLWDPYLAITMGHSEILIPNALFFWFDLWQRSADSSWTRISITSLNSQLRSEGIAGNFYLANNSTVGGGVGPGALIPGGNANDSVAALGKIEAGVYTEYTLCNCTISPSFPCPQGWNAHIGGVNLCKNSNQNWGHVSAIDRFDGKYAVVVYDPSLFPQPIFEFFQFNTTDGLWYWVYEVRSARRVPLFCLTFSHPDPGRNHTDDHGGQPERRHVQWARRIWQPSGQRQRRGAAAERGRRQLQRSRRGLDSLHDARWHADRTHVDPLECVPRRPRGVHGQFLRRDRGRGQQQPGAGGLPRVPHARGQVVWQGARL